ncbi:MAG: hypothetical protein M3083_24670 [Actinomycetota bacterium]|nr:hypothetical protein [Actinomycetota bacterium]MDQ6948448.1 hypothetical protein [Actinomycetota bacterium]
MASKGPKVLLSVSGTGLKKTEKFTTSSNDWDLAWSYDCSKFFGGKGNFQVYVNGQVNIGGLSNLVVNELGASGSSVGHFHEGGTLYLEVNSECTWTVKVTG